MEEADSTEMLVSI